MAQAYDQVGDDAKTTAADWSDASGIFIMNSTNWYHNALNLAMWSGVYGPDKVVPDEDAIGSDHIAYVEYLIFIHQHILWRDFSEPLISHNAGAEKILVIDGINRNPGENSVSPYETLLGFTETCFVVVAC